MTKDFDFQNPPKNWPFPTKNIWEERAKDLLGAFEGTPAVIHQGNLGEKDGKQTSST